MGRVRMLLLATILSSGTGAIEASAQTPDAGIDQSVAKRPWWLLWSRTSRENRVLPAMWTLHIHHVDDGISNDNLVGVMYRGVYAATFITTHDPRGYSLGLERNWVSGGRGPFAGMLGFRAGLLYGYDERLGWVAGKYPVIPFLQPVVYGRLGPVTADLTYTWVVVSLTAGVRF